MTDGQWDAIIVGQGLAGTTLAWHLHEVGWRVLLIDAHDAVTSSKIAAGLITPITGQRLVLTQKCEEFVPVAQSFYFQIEHRTGRRFFHQRRSLRLFCSEEEQQSWLRRRDQPLLQSFLVNSQPAILLDRSLGDASYGGFEMKGAQLEVATYLAASRSTLPWVSMRLDWRRDVTIGENEVEVRGYRARLVISCEGYAAAQNPYFSPVPFVAAKGDILTVRFCRPVPAMCIHRGIWIAPTQDPEIFKAGSTYDWKNLDQEPSVSARNEIERKLQEFFHVPYVVLDHQAAVRPIIRNGEPVIGLHPAHPRLGYFNGLGSKGVLLAPFFARCFTDFLLYGRPLPETVDLRNRF
jgi:glycine oxidase